MQKFPFKTLTCYEVIATFKSPRSEDVFQAGKKLTYLSSSLNHYEGIEICIFRDIESGKELTWHADEAQLEKWNKFFLVSSWPG
jgi:hypothetical protein